MAEDHPWDTNQKIELNHHRLEAGFGIGHLRIKHSYPNMSKVLMVTTVDNGTKTT